MPEPTGPDERTIVQVAFEVHDATALHRLARTLWTTSNGSPEGVDEALGPEGRPDLAACIRETISDAAIGVTFSFA